MKAAALLMLLVAASLGEHAFCKDPGCVGECIVLSHKKSDHFSQRKNKYVKGASVNKVAQAMHDFPCPPTRPPPIHISLCSYTVAALSCFSPHSDAFTILLTPAPGSSQFKIIPR